MNTNLNLRSNGLLLIGKLSRLLAIIAVDLSVSAFQCSFLSGNNTSGGAEGRGWRVWIRAEPCPGRFDWLSVSKEQPGGGSGAGLGTFWLYDNYLSRQGCTEPEPNGCTFAEAKALMETLRGDKKFFDFCCKDYSVSKNTQTGKMTVVIGKFGNAGFGWEPVKGDLCCEEAEALAGIPGACSGSQAPPLGPIVRRTPGNSNTTTGGNNGGTNNNGGEVVTNTPIVMQTPPPSTPLPPVSNRWTLVSVTAIPETPDQKMGWSYRGAQASSANMKVYNGTTFDFQWTKPPAQIDENGFTISLNIQCQPRNEPGCSGILGVTGKGIESDTPRGQWLAEANGRNGASGSGQKSVTLKPSPNASELEVEIGMMWGAVRFVYKYRRAQ